MSFWPHSIPFSKERTQGRYYIGQRPYRLINLRIKICEPAPCVWLPLKEIWHTTEFCIKNGAKVSVFHYLFNRICNRSILIQLNEETSYLPFLVKVDVFTPITWPYESINGPPEFPVHIRAHIRSYVCIVLSKITWRILRIANKHYHLKIGTSVNSKIIISA